MAQQDYPDFQKYRIEISTCWPTHPCRRLQIEHFWLLFLRSLALRWRVLSKACTVETKYSNGTLITNLKFFPCWPDVSEENFFSVLGNTCHMQQKWLKIVLYNILRSNTFQAIVSLIINRCLWILQLEGVKNEFLPWEWSNHPAITVVSF